MFWFKSKVDSEGVKYASGAVRAFSVMADLLIISAVVYFFDLIFVRIFGLVSALDTDLVERYMMDLSMTQEDRSRVEFFFWNRAIFELIKFFFVACFFIYSWSAWATTPAKWLFGIIIVNHSDLSNLGIVASIKRFIGVFISVLPVFLGIIWSSFDKRGQAWHDKIAGSVVVFRSTLPGRR